MKKYLDFVSLVRTHGECEGVDFYQFLFHTSLPTSSLLDSETDIYPPSHLGLSTSKLIFLLFSPFSAHNLERNIKRMTSLEERRDISGTQIALSWEFSWNF